MEKSISHTFIPLSIAPHASSFPSGEIATQLIQFSIKTSDECPIKVNTKLSDSASQILTLPSAATLTTNLPSGEKAIAKIWRLCPFRVVISSPSLSVQSFKEPSEDPEAIYCPLGDIAMHRSVLE